MIKRIISGLLSAVMSTALLTTEFDTVKQANGKPNDEAAKTLSNDGMLFNSSNSFGNYISDMMQENEQPKDLGNRTAENYGYDLGYAELDRETGIMDIYSTQPENAKILIIVKDEDTKEVTYTTEIDVEKGTNTVNTVNIDVKAFPEYFTVDLQLFDKFNNAVGEVYTLTTYIRFVQEMKTTDIYDYDEEYVVNLDEDESTNFIVLSENTIQGKTTEDTNVLVSADYENDQYVFEHIDDVIRYLDKGDHFFIRPTENDIIALSVEDIVIDGDRATITGGENIEGLFDVIKIEASADDVTDATLYDEELPDNMKFNGIVEDDHGEPALEYTFEDAYDYKSDYPVYDKSIEEVFDFTKYKVEDKDKVDLSKPDFCNIDEPDSNKKIHVDADIIGKLTVAAGINFDFYMKWTHVDFQLKFTPSVTIELGIEGSLELNQPLTAYPIGFVIVPGLWFGFEPQLTFKVEGSIKYTAYGGCDIILSFDTSRKKMFSSSCEVSEEKPLDDLSIEGNVSISLDIQPMFYAINSNVVAIKLSVPIEVGVDCKSNNLLFNKREITKDSPHTIILSEDRHYYEDTLHICEKCFELQPYFSAKIELKLDVICLPFLDEIKKTLFESRKFELPKLYYSATNKKFGYGECPHQAYKTTFDIFDYWYLDKDVDAKVVVDGLESKVKEYYVTYFYCENGTHNYKVYVDGKEVKSGSFEINDAVKKIEVTRYEDFVSEGEKRVTTEPNKRVTITDYVQDIPERSPETKHIESGRLGDNLFYYIYANGEMNIYGHGDMYSDSNPYNMTSPINNIDKIKSVFFVDDSPANGQYITSIRNNLFRGATNLETVYLSNEITRIEDNAFNGCKNLKYFRYGGEDDTSETLVLPSKLKTIGKYAFYQCESAEFGNLVFGDALDKIGENAFGKCVNITNVVIPENVKVIDSFVFYDCSNIKTAVIKADVDTMGAGIFMECEKLEEVTLPRFTTFHVGKNDFSQIIYLFTNYQFIEPEHLSKITILSGTEVPDRAFWEFNNVTTIALPQGITQIGNEAFRSIDNLERIICCDETKELTFSELFANVENIGESAFAGDSKLVIGDLVFGGNLEKIGAGAFADCISITSILIPENVAIIEPCIFSGCSNMTTAVIKANVDTLGAGIFTDCTSLKEVTLPGFITFYIGNRQYREMRYLFTTYEYKEAKKLRKITILSGTEIPERAFSELDYITTIALPQGITKIGKRAFCGIDNLERIICCDETKNLTFSELFANVEYIDESAFHDDAKLEIGDLVFGGNLEKIGAGAFINCISITSILIPENVAVIEPGIFSGCSNMTTAVIKANVDTLGVGIFTDCTSLKEVTLPGFITFYSGNRQYREMRYLFTYYEYKEAKNLRKITILSGTEIPEEAFSELDYITTIALPQGITKIGKRAFCGIDNLERIICCDETKNLTFSELFANVEYIDESAFRDDAKLEIGDLVFGGNLEKIDAMAFADCLNITSILIPENVAVIESGAFYGCSKIKTVAIKATIGKMGMAVFKECNSLEKLIIPEFITFSINNNSNSGLYGLFYNSSGLSIPKKLKEIVVLSGETVPDKYFDYFGNVKTLSLPKELVSVGIHATHDMTALTEVYYYGPDEIWNDITVHALETQNEPLYNVERIQDLYGDANCDGNVDMSDVTLIMQSLTSPDLFGIYGSDETHITERGIYLADIDHNGLTVDDALRIQEYLLGKIESLA